MPEQGVWVGGEEVEVFQKIEVSYAEALRKEVTKCVL